MTPTTALWPLSPDKVLGCRAEWAERYPEQLAGLLRALYRASVWTGRLRIMRRWRNCWRSRVMSGRPQACSIGRWRVGWRCVRVRSPCRSADFYVPASHHANFPWVSHALWLYTQMVRWRQVEFSAEHLAAVPRDLPAGSVPGGPGATRSRHSSRRPEGRALLRRSPLRSRGSARLAPTERQPVLTTSSCCTNFVH